MYLVQWGQEYWLSVMRLDGGTGHLHEALAQTRAILQKAPREGNLADEDLDLYVVRATVFMGLLTVRILYQVNEPFVNLLDVEAIPE